MMNQKQLVIFKNYADSTVECLCACFNNEDQKELTRTYNGFQSSFFWLCTAFPLSKDELLYLVKVNNAVYETYMTFLKSM